MDGNDYEPPSPDRQPTAHPNRGTPPALGTPARRATPAALSYPSDTISPQGGQHRLHPARNPPREKLRLERGETPTPGTGLSRTLMGRYLYLKDAQFTALGHESIPLGHTRVLVSQVAA